jgi:3-hydroxyacyl-[acyl-carrier-protein] dehydratase
MRVEACDVYRALPQRYPFLLIDRVIELVEGQSVCAHKVVSLSDYVYSALPDHPADEDFAYPDALLIEALAQSAGVLLRHSWQQLDSERHLVMFGSFAGISIHSRAFPGDVLQIDARLDAVNEDAAVISGRIECNGRLLMEAKSVSAMLRATSDLPRS